MITGNVDKIVKLQVRRADTGEMLTTGGREAWALAHLISRGKEGVTALERPAPRWAHYVFLLRRHGLPVQTIEERHSGPYSGRHARYLLDTPVEVIDEEYAA